MSLDKKSIISRIHAAVSFQGKAYYLEDSGSLNGTSLNGEALKPGARFRRQLKAGDTITFGRYQKVNFTFELED